MDLPTMLSEESESGFMECSNLQHYSTQGKTHEPRITPAEEVVYLLISAPATMRFRRAASIY